MTPAFAVGTVYFQILTVIEIIILLLLIDAKSPVKAILSIVSYFLIITTLGDFNANSHLPSFGAFTCGFLIISYTLLGILASYIGWASTKQAIKKQIRGIKKKVLEECFPAFLITKEWIDKPIKDESVENKFYEELKEFYGISPTVKKEYVLKRIFPSVDESEHIFATYILFWPVFLIGSFLRTLFITPIIWFSRLIAMQRRNELKDLDEFIA